jgi:iron uptake system EfeUOB component EfeO/EfeM
MRQKNGYSEEELCDINANFDPSETVVDVVTGQIIRGAV